MTQLDAPASWPFALALAALIAGAAWRLDSLTRNGALAATLIGILALRASSALGALLITWFVLAAILSAFGKSRKATRVRQIVAKSERRDATQVFANGAVFTMIAASVIFVTKQESPAMSVTLCIAAAGALAAAGADTWATEIGTLYGKAPWSLRTGSRVPPGTSGAITVVGTAALVLGALVVAAVAVALHAVPVSGRAFAAVSAGGIAGAFTDTMLGAWMQQRRWCPRCSMETEQVVHVCGTDTAPTGGVQLLDNDAVNFLCTLVGAVVAAGVAVV